MLTDNESIYAEYSSLFGKLEFFDSIGLDIYCPPIRESHKLYLLHIAQNRSGQ
jgi:hypothetical protein